MSAYRIVNRIKYTRHIFRNNGVTSISFSLFHSIYVKMIAITKESTISMNRIFVAKIMLNAFVTEKNSNRVVTSAASPKAFFGFRTKYRITIHVTKNIMTG